MCGDGISAPEARGQHLAQPPLKVTRRGGAICAERWHKVGGAVSAGDMEITAAKLANAHDGQQQRIGNRQRPVPVWASAEALQRGLLVRCWGVSGQMRRWDRELI